MIRSERITRCSVPPKGGWSPLSSEGRFMGAAAWGNGDRLINPFYKQLRQVFYLGLEGTVSINRLMANWQNAGHAAPFGKDLIDVIGEPIPMERLRNPDCPNPGSSTGISTSRQSECRPLDDRQRRRGTPAMACRGPCPQRWRPPIAATPGQMARPANNAR